MLIVYKWTRKRMPIIGHKRKFSHDMRDSASSYTAVVCKKILLKLGIAEDVYSWA